MQLNTFNPSESKTSMINRKAEPSPSSGERVCTGCGTSKTPLWRRNQDGKLVCNACGKLKLVNFQGLYLKVNKSKRPDWLKTRGIDRSVSPLSNQTSSHEMLYECKFCKTSKSFIWRHDEANRLVCNSCDFNRLGSQRNFSHAMRALHGKHDQSRFEPYQAIPPSGRSGDSQTYSTLRLAPLRIPSSDPDRYRKWNFSAPLKNIETPPSTPKDSTSSYSDLNVSPETELEYQRSSSPSSPLSDSVLHKGHCPMLKDTFSSKSTFPHSRRNLMSLSNLVS
jgi:hypothetical protein